MSQVRINFLNWRPDQDDNNTDGLITADNVIHEPEGYKAVHLMSGGSFATTGGLAASTATILSCVAKPIGSQGDLFCAWVSQNGLQTNDINVGINGVTATSTSTGYPLTAQNATTGALAITFFDVCELENKIFFNVRAQNAAGASQTSLAFAGYMDFE